MKDSVGTVSGGIRTGGVSAGMRASGGTVRMGGLSSPEARFGGASSKFSSRGLSNFNRSPIGFKEIGGVRSSNSIVNINRGKEAKSKSARTPSLGRQRSMFDVSRPIRHSPVSRPSEFGVKVSLRNGREARPSKARTNSLLTPRPMFDMSRKPVNMGELGRKMSVGKIENIRPAKPAEKNFVIPRRAEMQKFQTSIPKETHKTVAGRTREVGFNPRVRSERVKRVSPFTDTVILWQRKDVSPRVKLEAGAKFTGKSEQPNMKKRKVRTMEQVRQNRVEQVKKVKRIKTERPKRVRVGSRIKALPEVSQDVKNLVNADIKHAQEETVYKMIRGYGVSYDAAVTQVVQDLAEKHEGKVKVMPAVKTQVEAQTQPQTEVQARTHTQPQVETELKAEGVEEPKKEKKTLMKKIFGKKTETEEKKLYFKKDEKANAKRVEHVQKALERIKRWGKNEITGKDIIDTLGNSQINELSELTRLQGVDYRLQGFRRMISYMGEITDTKDFVHKVMKFADYFSAVKLSASQNEGESATGQDAIDVYGKSIYKVDAYVEDEGGNGELRADAIAQKVTVIKNGKNQILYRGVTEENQNLSSDIPRAA